MWAERTREILCKVSGGAYDSLLVPLFRCSVCHASTGCQHGADKYVLSLHRDTITPPQPHEEVRLATPNERTVWPWVTTLKEFIDNFDSLSCGQFRSFDWNNVVVAGGSVLACLQDVSGAISNRNKLSSKFGSRVDIAFYEQFHAHPDSDVDIFLYGLTSADATSKVIAIHNLLGEAVHDISVSNHNLVVRTTNTL
ncbi:hypothetical protein Pelo_7692 [Pelomyxa schiedti]|nr:hypothetical protein Pelo_7692 [Pelomyxa schiedti]